nr:EF-hand domain-containing protein [Pseudoxanthomonas dokdonensis]
MTRKSMMMIAVLTALSASAAWAAAPAATDGAGARPRLDANNDGAIDKAEAAKSPWLAQQFDSLDKNHDGRLSADERPQHRQRKGTRGGHGGPHAAMARLDVNHDGKLSRDEAKADPRMAARFDSMDANGDGFVDRSDRELAEKKRRDQWFTDADSDKDGKLTRAEVAAADARRDGQRREQMQARMQQRFEGADSNKDGKLSRDEVKQNPRLSQKFDQMDSNKDGYLGKDELQSAHPRR